MTCVCVWFQMSCPSNRDTSGPCMRLQTQLGNSCMYNSSATRAEGADLWSSSVRRGCTGVGQAFLADLAEKRHPCTWSFPSKTAKDAVAGGRSLCWGPCPAEVQRGRALGRSLGTAAPLAVVAVRRTFTRLAVVSHGRQLPLRRWGGPAPCTCNTVWGRHSGLRADNAQVRYVWGGVSGNLCLDSQDALWSSLRAETC